MDSKWLDEIEVLNNRETAISIWLTLLLIFLFLKRDVRGSFTSLVRSIFAYKIVTSYLLSVLYTSIGIYLLYRLDGWTSHQLKDAILWCTLTIMKTLLRNNEVNEKKDYFKVALKENLKFTLIIEFISETYSFPLIAELILVPTLVIMSSMLAFVQYDKKYSNIIPFINWMLILIGLASITHALYEIITHFGEFANADKLREFLLPPYLAIWFLPWLYLMSIWMRFETAFIRFNFKRMDKPLHNLAKRTAILNFLFDPEGLERWTMDLQRRAIETPSDLKESLSCLSAMRSAEKNPPEVDPASGWSPYAAKDFLKEKGITTRYYQNVYEDEWSASSTYIKLEEDFLSNHIAFYVSGSREIAKKLTLIISINSAQHEKNGLARFELYARTLFSKACIESFPATVAKKIRSTRNASFDSGNYKITLEKEDFRNSKHQYSYSLNIYCRKSK